MTKPPRMRRWVTVWVVLLVAHVALIALGWIVGSAWLAPVVVASIYLPLWPLGKLGIPVISSSGWLFPPPTPIGWVAIVLSWVIFYSGVAWLIGRLIGTRNALGR